MPRLRMGQQGVGRMYAAEVLKRDKNMEHILSLSYGKDSLACLGAIEKLGWPLDRIVHAEVWATDTIPADLPPMVEFKAKADKIIKERWGVEVEHVYAMQGGEKLTYEKVFYRKRKFSKGGNPLHKMYGWPFQKGAWCNNRLKVDLLNKAGKGCIHYIGIAEDEPKRFHVLSEIERSPLVEAGWTEADCRRWCDESGLLSPIYTTAARGGCWFCHNQGVEQLRLLRKNYPDLWALMLKWDADSPVPFKSSGHTVHDYEERFALEDNGFIAVNDKFLWDMLKYSQISVDYYTRSDFVE